MKDLVTDANLACSEEGIKLQVCLRFCASMCMRERADLAPFSLIAMFTPTHCISPPFATRRPWTRATSH